MLCLRPLLRLRGILQRARHGIRGIFDRVRRRRQPSLKLRDGANKDTSGPGRWLARPRLVLLLLLTVIRTRKLKEQEIRVTLAVIIYVWQVRVQLETGMTDISIDVAYGSGFGVWALENVGCGALGLNPRTQKPQLPNFESNQSTSLVAAVLTPLPGIHRWAVTAQGASLLRLS